MKVLIVEDDGLTAEALVAMLSNQNYTVEVASDGETGWALAEAFAYDLVLLDVTLPKLDGISLCQRLRSHNYQMPILLLTARDSSHDKAIGLDAGADDYVVKPFDPEELAARIRALLRRNQATVQSVLEWGNLRLDPSSCEVTYETRLLALTAKRQKLKAVGAPANLIETVYGIGYRLKLLEKAEGRRQRAEEKAIQEQPLEHYYLNLLK